jgi:hypothetical protein
MGSKIARTEQPMSHLYLRWLVLKSHNCNNDLSISLHKILFEAVSLILLQHTDVPMHILQHRNSLVSAA